MIGHLAFWSMVFNQVHATAWPRRSRKISEKIIYLTVIGLGVLLVGSQWFFSTSGYWFYQALRGYFWFCFAVSWIFIVRWLYRKLIHASSPVVSFSATRIHLADKIESHLLHGWQARLLNLIPYNQVTQLSVEQLSLAVPALPDKLVGLTIAHLSDLHYTGKIDVRYFQELVRQTNKLNADIVCLTGDIIDSSKCLNWIDSTLAEVEARHGKFFILGNHDRRVEDDRLTRERMVAGGWQDLGEDWIELNLAGRRIAFAGNELPWYPGARTLSDRNHDSDELALLLAHSPDQFSWAVKRGFNLVLAGHTHGGQIRFPLIGPVIAPSRHGVKYASGSFQRDNTVMHVSRGVSGDEPIRLNCPPELSLITLVRPQ